MAAVLAGHVGTNVLSAAAKPQSELTAAIVVPSPMQEGSSAEPTGRQIQSISPELATLALPQVVRGGSSLSSASTGPIGDPLVTINKSLVEAALELPLPPPSVLDQVAQALKSLRIYSVYKVQQGDTVTGISRRFGLSIDSLLWNNGELRDDPNYLKPGQQLVVPSTDGLVYYVKLGDTLDGIASTHALKPDAILAFKPNRLSQAGDLKDGVELLLPGGTPPALLAAAAAPVPAPRSSGPSSPAQPTRPGYNGALSVGVAVQVAGTGSCLNARSAPGGDVINGCLREGFVATISDGPSYVNGLWWWHLQGQGWSVDSFLRVYDGSSPPAPAGPVSGSGFIWPVAGRVTDGFGVPRGGRAYHTGIDISVRPGSGVPVAAAAGGTVVSVVHGWGAGLGNHVIISHGNGLETVYAHLSSTAVQRGQSVAQGAIIGYTGCTGYCLGEHLHFEIRKGGAPLNPLNYLP